MYKEGLVLIISYVNNFVTPVAPRLMETDGVMHCGGFNSEQTLLYCFIFYKYE